MKSLVIGIICLLPAIVLANTSGTDTDTHQEPNQIDCQKIVINEKYLGGKVFERKICFYDVVIGDNKHITMWHELNSDKYGFVK